MNEAAFLKLLQQRQLRSQSDDGPISDAHSERVFNEIKDMVYQIAQIKDLRFLSLKTTKFSHTKLVIVDLSVSVDDIQNALRT